MPRRPRVTGPLITRAAAVLVAAVAAVSVAAAPASAAPVTPSVAAPTSAGVDALGMSPNSAAVAAIIRSNEQTAFSYFVGKGLTKRQAAGIVGNLDQESGMDPTIAQDGGGPGRGIAQWSVGGRWDTYGGDNLVSYASGKGLSRYSLSAQLGFVWYELTKFSYYGLSSVKASTTITGAVTAFQDKYEGCGDCNTSARVSYATDAYNRYA